MSIAAQSEHTMALWGPRRAISLKDARQRTALVHILRLVFTVGAVLSAGWILGTVIESTLRDRTAPSSAAGVSITVHAPRFDGFDSQDRPYTLTAMTAQRRRDNLSLVDLVNPRLKDHTSTTVQAREGVWNAELEVLDLQGDVVMTDAAGYTFTSQKTRMYVKDSRVEGQEPLNGRGPIGEVRSDAYEVLDDGNRIVLKGNVWTKFTPKKRKNR
jgi:lipopolysaccharide export system protein LptC